MHPRSVPSMTGDRRGTAGIRDGWFQDYEIIECTRYESLVLPADLSPNFEPVFEETGGRRVECRAQDSELLCDFYHDVASPVWGGRMNWGNIV